MENIWDEVSRDFEKIRMEKEMSKMTWHRSMNDKDISSVKDSFNQMLGAVKKECPIYESPQITKIC